MIKCYKKRLRFSLVIIIIFYILVSISTDKYIFAESEKKTQQSDLSFELIYSLKGHHLLKVDVVVNNKVPNNEIDAFILLPFELNDFNIKNGQAMITYVGSNGVSLVHIYTPSNVNSFTFTCDLKDIENENDYTTKIEAEGKYYNIKVPIARKAILQQVLDKFHINQDSSIKIFSEFSGVKVVFPKGYTVESAEEESDNKLKAEKIEEIKLNSSKTAFARRFIEPSSVDEVSWSSVLYNWTYLIITVLAIGILGIPKLRRKDERYSVVKLCYILTLIIFVVHTICKFFLNITTDISNYLIHLGFTVIITLLFLYIMYTVRREEKSKKNDADHEVAAEG